jgi:predicted ATPase/DNA-binding SARP family transcriptional activator
MEFRILGAFEVVGTAGIVDVRGSKRRGLLACLVVHAGQPMSTDRLVEELWAGRGPDGAARTVQTYVSQLRGLLRGEEASLATGPGGYVLRVASADVDAQRFEQEVTAAGAEADPTRRLAMLDGPLALWRGPPLGEFAGVGWADREARRLEAVHLQALHRRYDALLELGRPGEAAGELDATVRAHPHDERFWAQLMVALYRSGRQADALAAYQQARGHLVDDLGIEPGPELTALEHRILDHDPALVATVRRPTPVDEHRVPIGWPSGLVTFVLTDIEGSTRLLRRLENRYEEVIERHDTLLRTVWEEHGGAHVSARGDSCLAAFGNAGTALRACADAQRRLAGDLWPPDGRPRVRMGVHTGLASPRNGDYVALAVHQAARVTAAAHGGQILASEVAATDVGAQAGLALRSVGRYRLRDFDVPVQLFELAGPGLDADFPAVRAMPVGGHNLPCPPTSFVGREADVAEVLTLIGAGKLLTLSGPGGVGKSRLALAVGLAAASSWSDGVWLVDLARVQEARLIGAAVANVLGVAADARMDGWHAALGHLRATRTLLVLDNCEHLAADVARLVADLLAACTDVGVLATSREPLGTALEVVWRVAPLAVPGSGVAVAEVESVPSVRLFVERVRATLPGFAIDDGNVQTVAELCRRLDGLPLALELAAAQTSVLSATDLLRGLDDRFRFLRSRKRGVPDRQRTMDAVMEWSYRLLSADEQAVLRRVSVFRSGFTLDAAVVSGRDLEGCDVLAAAWSLVDKSLVVVDLTANETRYRLLETVRDYARRLLDDEGAAATTAMRLATWWLDRIGPWRRMDRVRSGEIEVELDNLRALVPLVAKEDEERAQQLALSIGQYNFAVRVTREGIGELSRYAADLAMPSPARVSLLATLALLHAHHGDIDAARPVLEQAEQVRRIVGAAPIWDEVAVARATGEVALRSGDHAVAAELARHALDGDLTPRARARMLNLLAISSYFKGEVGRAAAAFNEELEVARRLGDEHLMVIAEGNVAELALRQGDTASAATHQAACLDLALALGRPVSVAHSFIIAARLTAETEPARAGQLHAKAEEVLVENDYQLYDDDQRASTLMLDRLRELLGDVEFDRARERGRSLTWPDAVSLAQDALAELST